LAQGLAALAVFVLALLPAAARADQSGTFAVSFTQMKYWLDGFQLRLQDLSTNYTWSFPHQDSAFYTLLNQLNGVGAGNLTQIAYVGVLNGGSKAVVHNSWEAPLQANGSASKYPGAFPQGAKKFNTTALSVQWSDTTHDYILTDGSVVVADFPTQAPLQMLQQMLQSHGLNVEWQIPLANDYVDTPSGSDGPLDVFLNIGGPASGSPSSGMGSSQGDTAGGVFHYTPNLGTTCPKGDILVNGQCKACATGPQGFGLPGTGDKCTPTVACAPGLTWNPKTHVCYRPSSTL